MSATEEGRTPYDADDREAYEKPRPRASPTRTDPKDVPTDEARVERTEKGERRQVEEAEDKDKVTGAW